MIDAEDLACRYVHLWQDYLTALMAHLREPGAATALDRCLLGACRKSGAA
jgi:hypothetical protein